MTKKYWSGFTLIELLVVIFIIGLLASIVVVSVNAARKKARDARRIADLDTVRTALEMYADANGGKYPVQGVKVESDGKMYIKWNKSDLITDPLSPSSEIEGTDLDWVGAVGGNPLADFLPVLPVDPINRERSGSRPTQAYAYSSLDGNEYKIIAYNMESAEGQAKAANDGGVFNSSSSAYHYELFSAGAQWYQDCPKNESPCTFTYP